ncbi:sigma factor-like helix-turn-helix DNA-binding protein [Macrococcus armenti]|uniref:sigma factor-like helix-turn-helix DNA-binding protein n=1 Tax=Macrococcus armenti TaxID=2875764 RepID=UPI001CC910DE|nr:sigma factor-like helix-turn-helix DNA-binding protein [Macrococcus armenti]UBH12434.1 LuxR C-terminal-related transcriptional regulator [Macrococcus armenti]
MKDLLIEYMQSLKDLEVVIKNFNDKHAEAIKKHEKLGDKQNAANPIIKELSTLNSMKNELQFIITWLRTGHNPNEHNAIDKTNCYLVDHQVLEEVIDNSQYIKVSEDEYEDYIKDINSPISHALRKLSKRELEVFIMMDCEKMHARQVAELLNIKKTSVENYRERAKKKIDKEIYNNLFISL